MKHLASPRFWECYNSLPAAIRTLADRCFSLLKQNPKARSLRLKKAGRFWAVRVGRRYRALAVEIPDGLLWFWIGKHSEYERLIEMD